MSELQPRFMRNRNRKRGRNIPGEFRAIVCYRREDGNVILQRQGIGATIKETIRDADLQVPVGRWLRACVSTPATIYTDITASSPAARKRTATIYGEGVWIDVPEPVVVGKGAVPE